MLRTLRVTTGLSAGGYVPDAARLHAGHTCMETRRGVQDVETSDWLNTRITRVA